MSDEAIYAAASGAMVQKMRLEILSNNLANIETVGFKEDRAFFSSYIQGVTNGNETLSNLVNGSEETETSSPYILSNTQVKFEGTKTDFSQGPIRETGNKLDFALEGKGFFCIETSQGIQQYTRKGNFRLNEERELVTQDGSAVLGEQGGHIEINGNDITVDEEGNLTVDGITVDAIKVVDFIQPYPLIKKGDSSFIIVDPAAIETEADEVKIRQGAVELSNVDPIKVMTEMIEVHRAFESYQKIMRTMDEVISQSINEVGRTA